MAEFWIKVCKGTIDKPELHALATLLNIQRETAFGYWFRVYAWADNATADGFVSHMTLDALAELTHTPKEFCRLLGSESIGWVVETKLEDSGRPAGLYFRNWERHNGQCAKSRSEGARRTAECRARKKAKQHMKLRHVTM
jgi:hypothetical protein